MLPTPAQHFDDLSMITLGYQYAGLEYSKECWCGRVKPHTSLLAISPSLCNSSCPGLQDNTPSSLKDVKDLLSDIKNEDVREATCGGFFTADVYATDIQSKSVG